MWLIQLLIAAIGLIYIYQQREKEEDYLGIKLFGYCVLSNFAFWFGFLPIPLGFIIYLLFLKPDVNIKAKNYASGLGLVIFLLASIF